MMSFYEYITWHRQAALPDPRTMLSLMGIRPQGPQEVEVRKLVKKLKRPPAELGSAAIFVEKVMVTV